MQKKKDISKTSKRVSKTPSKKLAKTKPIKTSDNFSVFGMTFDKKAKSRVINLVVFKILPMLAALDISMVFYKRYIKSILRIVNFYEGLPPSKEKDYLLEEILGKGVSPYSILEKYMGSEINSDYKKTGIIFIPGIENRIPKKDYEALTFVKVMEDIRSKKENIRSPREFSTDLVSILSITAENFVVKNIAYRILKMKKQ